nr:VOC family protein [Luteipulveratus halotolerans]
MLAEARRDATPTRPFCGFAVDDTARAATFYRDMLGLDVTDGPMGLLTIWLGESDFVMAYPKETHVPAQHTILNIPVDDIDDAVASLVEQGVQMLRYDGFGQDEHGISRDNGGPPIAWFTDPAGNVLSVLQPQ